MGYITKEAAASLRPTQNYLEQNTIDFYVRQGDLMFDLPVPVVEDICFGNKYCLLDGHHHTAYSFLQGHMPTLWVAQSEKDLIPYDQFPGIPKEYIDACNDQIRRRFMEAMFFMPADSQGNDISSIEDLIKVNGIVFSKN